jgi:hypothetical protein
MVNRRSPKIGEKSHKNSGFGLAGTAWTTVNGTLTETFGIPNYEVSEMMEKRALGITPKKSYSTGRYA